MRALLIGNTPDWEMGCSYVNQPPYDGIVIGSMTIRQLLDVPPEQVLEALAQGKSVLVYTPGLPQCPGNRALGSALAARRRELKSWGVVFTEGSGRRLITAQQAKLLKEAGKKPGPGAVLTPLAREILEDKA
jgi:hypothetical protein